MHARLRGSKSLLNLYQIINNSLADEIAEPRPDINIKVVAFTESEKSSNTEQRPFLAAIEFIVLYNQLPSFHDLF